MTSVSQTLRGHFELMAAITNQTNGTGATAVIGEIQANHHHDQIISTGEKVRQHLEVAAGLRTSLSTAITALGAAFLSLAHEQRSRSSTVVGLVSTIAVFALSVLSVTVVGLVWGGHSFVVGPLRKTTRTILDLSKGSAICPVRLNRRTSGLLISEDAPENLRLASVEHERLILQTERQRTEMEANLSALADKSQELEHLARHNILIGPRNRRYVDYQLRALTAESPDRADRPSNENLN